MTCPIDRAPDHPWTRPQPPAPVPDNIRQLVNTKKVHP